MPDLSLSGDPLQRVQNANYVRNWRPSGPMTRRYKALDVRCPACSARVSEPCRNHRGDSMRGVHRDRDRAYNEREWRKLGDAVERGSQRRIKEGK